MSSTHGPERELASIAAGLAPALIVGILALIATWGTWPHLLVDFGRELYVPWRLVEGKVLYRDIAYFNGPLSPYFNALVFRLFGVGLDRLVAINLIFTTGLISLLYFLFRRISTPIGATVASTFFALCFAFNQVDGLGNDNYLTPYSHEATHGLMLALVSLTLFYAGRGGGATRIASGFCLGLVFLTKSEVFLAAFIGLGMALALDHIGRERRAWLRGVGVFVLAALVPVVGSVILLAQVLPLADAIRGTLGSWTSVFITELTSLHFYRSTLGTLDLAENLTLLSVWSLGYGVYGAALTAVAIGLGRRSGGGTGIAAEASQVHVWRSLLTPTSVILIALAYWLSAISGIAWQNFVRPLPLIIPGLALLLLVDLYRHPPAAEDLDRARLRISFVVFSAALLAKIVLRLRLDEYGFVLAMPATLILLVIGVVWWPRIVAERGGLDIVRPINLGLMIMLTLWILGASKYHLDRHTLAVGSGSDRFIGGAGTELVLPVLRDINALVAEDETLVVLPEGVMINYLTRRVNPTGYINFMPPEFVMFGEDAMLDRFRERPPDWVVLLSRDVEEYGLEGFGIDYGQALAAWLKQSYVVRNRYGAGEEHWRDGGFGLQLLRRKDVP